MTTEAQIIGFLADTKVWPILISSLNDYVRQTYCQPELIRVASSLRVAIIRELINDSSQLAIDAIAEPLWVDGIPLIFSKDLGEHYIVFTNKQIRKELRL